MSGALAEVDSRAVIIDAPRVVRSDVDGNMYPIEKFQQAYKLFMLEDKKPAEIALTVGLPKLVMLDFSAKNMWADRKAKILQEQVRMLEVEARVMQAMSKGEVIERQLRDAKAIAEKATLNAAEARNARDLKVATEAFKMASDVEARATGLAEKTVEKDSGAAAEQKAPSFFIGVGVSRVTVASGDSITVEQGPRDITKDVEVKGRNETKVAR
jgi:hypothetical protein